MDTVRRALEVQRERLQAEIRSYPPPIPACDQQFNHLLERRRGVARELAHLRASETDGVARRDGSGRGRLGRGREHTMQKAPEPVKAVWRLSIGGVLFAISLGCPAFIPLIAMTGLPATWKTTLSGLLVLGIPQLFTVAAIAVLGRDGFNFLRGKLFAVLRRLAPAHAVSRTRYRIGLALFIPPLLFGWLAPYAPDLVPGYQTQRVAINLAGDGMLLLSLFILGGEFWEKIRALFLYEATVTLPTSRP